MEDNGTELNTAVLESPAGSTDGTENGDAALIASGQANGHHDVAVGDGGHEKRRIKLLKGRKKKRKKKKRKKKKRAPKRKEHEALVFTFTLRRRRRVPRHVRGIGQWQRNFGAGQGVLADLQRYARDALEDPRLPQFQERQLDDANAASKLRLSKVQSTQWRGRMVRQHTHCPTLNGEMEWWPIAAFVDIAEFDRDDTPLEPDAVRNAMFQIGIYTRTYAQRLKARLREQNMRSPKVGAPFQLVFLTGKSWTRVKSTLPTERRTNGSKSRPGIGGPRSSSCWTS